MNIQARPLKDGRPAWRLEFRAGKDPATGKPLRVVETFRGTKREAERYWTKRQAEIDAQGAAYVRPAKETVGAYLERWLRDYGGQHLKPTTVRSYAELVRTHIVPGLGAVPLSDLTAAQVSAWQADLTRKQVPKGTKKDRTWVLISPRRVAYARAVLRAALNEAVRLGLLPANPVDRVRAPRQEAKEVQALTLEQALAVTRAAEGHRLEALYLLAWQTGMRRGELLGLRWEDVDFEAGTLRVRRNLVDLGGGRRVFQEPKTERGRRTVAMTPEVAGALRAHRARQVQERWAAGERWEDGDLVFCTATGGVLNPKNVARDWYRLLDKAGLPHQGFHTLRHTNATLARLAGVDIGDISKNLGHTSEAFTADRYAHVLPESQKAAAERFAAFVRERSARRPG